MFFGCAIFTIGGELARASSLGRKGKSPRFQSGPPLRSPIRTHSATERAVFVARALMLIIAACSMIAAPCRATSKIPFTFRNGIIWSKVEVAGQRIPLNAWE